MSVRMWFLLGIIAVTACEGCVDWNLELALFADGMAGHSLRGLCGLKYTICLGRTAGIRVTACEGCVDWNVSNLSNTLTSSCHSLRGLCGLKCHSWSLCTLHLQSQPARAVWIEMSFFITYPPYTVVTACEGCVDWNIFSDNEVAVDISHSLRGLCGLKYQW